MGGCGSVCKRHEHRLKRYWVTQVELAFDVRTGFSVTQRGSKIEIKCYLH